MAARVCVLMVMMMMVMGGHAAEDRLRARDGLMDRLTSGMKFAKDFLGSESVALKVAEFVVRAFQTTNKAPLRKRPVEGSQQDRYDSKPSTSNLVDQDEDGERQSPFHALRQMVKLFGLQPKQISAVAVNALLFVAQMISTFLAGPYRPTQQYRIEDPTSWILSKQSTRLQQLLASAKNESLPDIIEDLISERAPSEETSCIRLLVCKITPFVIKMQKTVFGNDDTDYTQKGGSGAGVLYRHLPGTSELYQRSEFCERKHSDCDLNE